MALRKLEHQSQGHDRRYAFKLYPTAEQDKVLCEQATMCAQLWNALLEMCERRYREAVQVQFFHHWRAPEGTVWVFGPGGRERDNQLIASGWKKIGVKKTRTFHCPECAARSAGGKTILCEAHKMPRNFDFGYWIGTPSSGEKALPEGHLLRDCPEWRKLSTWTPRRVGNSLAMAFAAFFRKDGRAGYPRYKSTRRDLSIPHRAVSGCMVAKSPRHDHSYQLRLRGVPGLVWARGRFPGGIVKYTDVDIKFDGIDWWASVACVINFDDPRHRGGGHDSIDIRFDLIDGFALANGELETPPEFVHAAMIEERAQELRSEFDQAWSRGKRLTEAEFTQRSRLCPDGPGNDAVLAAANERRKDLRDIARLRRRAARIRKNALHVWSTRTVRRAASLIVHDPAIKHHLKSPHGDRTDWGAATREVSELNRAVPGPPGQQREPTWTARVPTIHHPARRGNSGSRNGSQSELAQKPLRWSRPMSHTSYESVPLTKLIEEFRAHIDGLVEADDVDVGLRVLLEDIDGNLGRIERALASFRISLDTIAGHD